KYVIIIPFYWVMMSVAAMLALNQLIFKPHYWEKTFHGFHLGKEEKEKRYTPAPQPAYAPSGNGVINKASFPQIFGSELIQKQRFLRDSDNQQFAGMQNNVSNSLKENGKAFGMFSLFPITLTFGLLLFD